MAAYIHNIATAVPEQIYRQDFLREKMKEYLGNERATRSIIHRIYTQSGIDKRHTVVNDFDGNGDPRLFFREDGTMAAPSTAARNERYTEHARTLYVDIARSLLDGRTPVRPEEITHVITVSYTGFFAPGPGYEIIKELGLSPDTQRYHLGFMGCFAAFPAMKMAKAFCDTQEDATVMIVCLELCTLHLQRSESADSLISASVFADGGAGAIIRPQPPETGRAGLKLEQFGSTIVGDSESDMAWTIGDTGFDMVLSTYVPDIIQSNLRHSLKPLLKSFGTVTEQIDHWALHPGGRAILDKIEQTMKLRPEQLASSRSVLSRYGNMSSATVLFVLKELLDRPMEKPSEQIVSMAFGPGLTIESGLITKESGQR